MHTTLKRIRLVAAAVMFAAVAVLGTAAPAAANEPCGCQDWYDQWANDGNYCQENYGNPPLNYWCNDTHECWIDEYGRHSFFYCYDNGDMECAGAPIFPGC